MRPVADQEPFNPDNWMMQSKDTLAMKDSGKQ